MAVGVSTTGSRVCGGNPGRGPGTLSAPTVAQNQATSVSRVVRSSRSRRSS